MKNARIHITGIVQGVGFRPFVYNLAVRHGLGGFCLNDSEGVIIEVQGDGIEKFINDLKAYPPPLARIESLNVEPVTAGVVYDGFTIRESVREDGKSALISPDISICPDCLMELFDPDDRRYLYPFINCTNCGPRYSIVKDIPYDRARTTMAKFTLCKDCAMEYRDPKDRRFHAQPNACERCGPGVWLTQGRGRPEEGGNSGAVKKAQGLLEDGAILAVKGLGGFHLACDAANERAVSELRRRKRRPRGKGSQNNKPFALMAPDISAVKKFARLSEVEEMILTDRVRPIVLLEKKSADALAPDIAPNNGRFGVMLPYTPLHHLLFHGAALGALVMTSGNLSDEPIVTSNEEALDKLSGIADWFLLHDRDIHMRVDDSIVRFDKAERVLRRARGFTPAPVPLGEDAAQVLAFGAELKNTFCITKGKNAILSQHIGDLENYDALEFFKESLKNLKNTFKANPSALAHDMHPDYMSARFAAEYAFDEDIPDSRVIPVQHHHAHIASCMAEHGIIKKVIGVAFDGTGYGLDGNIWGGEFLTADRASFVRAAHLDYLRLPGGDMAVKEPWRMALSYLFHTFGASLPDGLTGFAGRLDPKKTDMVLKMIRSGINSPLTSSAGRLFDAVSSMLGVMDVITFEAEAAIGLEYITDIKNRDSQKPYGFIIGDGEPAVIDLRPLIKGIVDDIMGGVDRAVISGRFHTTLGMLIAETAKMIRGKTGVNDAALSGGVFQNQVLLEIAERRLTEAGFKVWTHSLIPSNDGGVSLGQAVVALERISKI